MEKMFALSFRYGLRDLRNQRKLFEIYVRSLLDEVSVEVSTLLTMHVVFDWQKDILTVRCPLTGGSHDIAKLTVLDDRDSSGHWAPIFCLRVCMGGEDPQWECRYESSIPYALRGMVSDRHVARTVAKLGKLRTEDSSEFSDIVLPIPEE